MSQRQVLVTPELGGSRPPPDQEATERDDAAAEEEEPDGPPAVPPLTVDAALIRTVRQGEESGMPAAPPRSSSVASPASPGGSATGGTGRILKRIIGSNLTRTAAVVSVGAVAGWLLFRGGGSDAARDPSQGQATRTPGTHAPGPTRPSGPGTPGPGSFLVSGSPVPPGGPAPAGPGNPTGPTGPSNHAGPPDPVHQYHGQFDLGGSWTVRWVFTAPHPSEHWYTLTFVPAPSCHDYDDDQCFSGTWRNLPDDGTAYAARSFGSVRVTPNGLQLTMPGFGNPESFDDAYEDFPVCFAPNDTRISPEFQCQWTDVDGNLGTVTVTRPAGR